MSRRPIRPDRIRRIQRGFAAIENRFLHGGFFVSLEPVERSLYFFLVLAGDRNGVSFYAYDKICSTLAVSPDEYVAARNALIDKDLVAFDGTCFQVLSLPPSPVVRPRPALTTQDDLERDDPATIRRLIRDSLGER
jgi:hypothetical protein